MGGTPPAPWELDPPKGDPYDQGAAQSAAVQRLMGYGAPSANLPYVPVAPSGGASALPYVPVAPDGGVPSKSALDVIGDAAGSVADGVDRYALQPISRVLGAPKAGVDWLARNVARGEGINVPDDMTTGQMVRNAAGLNKEETPSAGGRALGVGTEFLGDLASDPLTYLLAGEGGIASTGAKAVFGGEAPAILPKIGKLASAAFLPGMVSGAVREGVPAFRQYQQEGFTPEVAEHATRAALDAGFAALAGSHLLGGKHAASPVEQLLDEQRAAREAPAAPVASAPAQGPESPQSQDFVHGTGTSSIRINGEEPASAPQDLRSGLRPEPQVIVGQDGRPEVLLPPDSAGIHHGSRVPQDIAKAWGISVEDASNLLGGTGVPLTGPVAPIAPTIPDASMESALLESLRQPPAAPRLRGEPAIHGRGDVFGLSPRANQAVPMVEPEAPVVQSENARPPAPADVRPPEAITAPPARNTDVQGRVPLPAEGDVSPVPGGVDRGGATTPAVPAESERLQPATDLDRARRLVAAAQNAGTSTRKALVDGLKISPSAANRLLREVESSNPKEVPRVEAPAQPAAQAPPEAERQAPAPETGSVEPSAKLKKAAIDATLQQMERRLRSRDVTEGARVPMKGEGHNGPGTGRVEGHLGAPSVKHELGLAHMPEPPDRIANAIARKSGPLYEAARTAAERSDPFGYLEQANRPTENVDAEPHYAYRARNAGQKGIPSDQNEHAHATTSEPQAWHLAPSRTEAPQEMVRVDLNKLAPADYELKRHPSGMDWVKFRRPIGEHEIDKVEPVTEVDRTAAEKATPEVAREVEGRPVEELAMRAGLSDEEAAKGVKDVRADGMREARSPEATAVKRAALQAMIEQHAMAGRPTDVHGGILREIDQAKRMNVPLESMDLEMYDADGKAVDRFPAEGVDSLHGEALRPGRVAEEAPAGGVGSPRPEEVEPPKYATSRRPAPGQRGLEGIGEDVKREAPREEQGGLFGGPTERTKAGEQRLIPGTLDAAASARPRPTEGREANGPLFTQERDQAAKADAARQRTIGEGEKYAAAKAPTFYSQLERVATDKKAPQAASGNDWQRYLADAKRGVKADELRWSGLDDFLKERGTRKVTQPEIAEFLKQNNVQVKEVELGGPNQGGTREQAEAAATNLEQALKDAGVPSWRGVVQAIREGDGRAAEQARKALDGDADGLVGELVHMNETTGSGPTKFSSYVLPGGENYRELLLTTPGKESNAFDSFVKRMEAKYGAPIGAIHDELTPEEHTQAARLANAKNAPGSRFNSSHFDEPNVLAHVRFNERTDAAGKKVLFLEELQSDWGQKGRDEGFDNEAAFQRLLKARSAAADDSPEQDAIQRQIDEMGRKGGKGVPSGPFVEDTNAWSSLAMKRMVRWAAENGFDKIAWTKGKDQIGRYEDHLRQNVDRIEYEPFKADDGTQKFEVRALKDGRETFSEDEMTPDRVKELLGKDLAEKIANGAGQPTGGDARSWMALEGPDLSIGGEGMKTFYDGILPSVARKIGKKFGATVGETEIPKGRDLTAPLTYDGPERSLEELRALREQNRGERSAMVANQLALVIDAVKRGQPFKAAMEENASPALAREVGGDMLHPPAEGVAVHSMDITPEMRRSVVEEGQPLFKRTEDGPIGQAGSAGMQSRTRAAEVSAIPVGKETSIANPYGGIHPDVEALAPRLKSLMRSMETASDHIAKELGTDGKLLGISTDADFFGVTHGDNKSIRIGLPAIVDAAHDTVSKLHPDLEGPARDAKVRSEVADEITDKLIHEHVHVSAEAAAAKMTPEERAALAEDGGHGPAFQQALKASYLKLADSMASIKSHIEARLGGDSGAAVRELGETSKKAWKEAGHGRYREYEAAPDGADQGGIRAEGGTDEPGPPAVGRDAGGGEAPRIQPGEVVPAGGGVDGEAGGAVQRGRTEVRPIPPKYATAPPAEGDREPLVDQNVSKLREGEEETPGARPATLSRDEVKLNAQLIDDAREISGQPDAYFYRQIKKGPLDDAETVAWRQRVDDKEALRNTAQDALEAAKKNGEPTAALEQDALNKSLDHLKALEAKVEGGTAQGRALQARNVLDRFDAKSPESVATKLLKAGISKESIADVMDAVHRGDPQEINKALMKAFKPSLSDKLYEAWINGMLSAPSTTITKSVSDLLSLVGGGLERGVASRTDAARARWTNTPQERVAGEAWAHMGGLKEGLTDAFANARKAWNEEATPIDKAGLDPLDQGRAPYAIGGVGGKIIRAGYGGGGTRALRAVDAFSKTLARAAEKRVQALRIATQEGGTRAEVAARAEEIARTPENQLGGLLGAKKANGMLGSMDEYMNRATYTAPYGPRMSKIVAGINAMPGGDIIFPFMRVPWNLAVEGAKATPMNLLKVMNDIRTGKLKGGAASEALVRPVLGTAAMMGVAMAAQAGQVTGNGPEDPNARKAWMAAGNQPYSVKTPAGWVSYKRIEPFATIIGLAADSVEATHEKKKIDMAMKAVAGLEAAFTQKTFLTGMEDIGGILKDPIRYGKQYAQDLESSVVPNILAKGAQALDPTVRDASIEHADDILRPIEARLPGLSQNVPAKGDLTGLPVERGGTAAERFLSPFARSADPSKYANLESEMARIGYAPGQPSRDFKLPNGKTVELTDAEYEKLMRFRQRAADSAARAILSPSYRNALDAPEDAPLGSSMGKYSNTKEAIIRRSFDQAQQEFRADYGQRILRRARSEGLF